MLTKGAVWIAVASLAVCLAAPVLYFAGRVDMAVYKTVLASATAGWFIFAIAGSRRPGK